ncbi:MAG TPA: hypothetical protein VHX14_19165 [Thermoanaerobaculia bacterium]|nr:hypothetical protein [Thermoanaerobaculia bacterium]
MHHSILFAFAAPLRAAGASAPIGRFAGPDAVVGRNAAPGTILDDDLGGPGHLLGEYRQHQRDGKQQRA